LAEKELADKSSNASTKYHLDLGIKKQSTIRPSLFKMKQGTTIMEFLFDGDGMERNDNIDIETHNIEHERLVQ
jgi:hypothetical protein